MTTLVLTLQQVLTQNALSKCLVAECHLELLSDKFGIKIKNPKPFSPKVPEDPSQRLPTFLVEPDADKPQPAFNYKPSYVSGEVNVTTTLLKVSRFYFYLFLIRLTLSRDYSQSTWRISNASKFLPPAKDSSQSARRTGTTSSPPRNAKNSFHSTTSTFMEGKPKTWENALWMVGIPIPSRR
jgi:hypothetical protein